MQNVAPGPLIFPVAHEVHVAELAEDAYDPALQSLHLLYPNNEYLPLEQATQEDAPEVDE